MDNMTSEMQVSAIVELRPRGRDGMVAVVYRGKRRRKLVPLRDGAIVEAPTPRQRGEAPARVESCIAVASGGGPASVHHFNLGLVAAYLALEGVFVLPTGEVAAVYGARATPLGLSSLTVESAG